MISERKVLDSKSKQGTALSEQAEGSESTHLVIKKNLKPKNSADMESSEQEKPPTQKQTKSTERGRSPSPATSNHGQEKGVSKKGRSPSQSPEEDRPKVLKFQRLNNAKAIPTVESNDSSSKNAKSSNQLEANHQAKDQYKILVSEY